MDEKVHPPVFQFLHVTVVVYDGLAADDDGEHPGKGDALPDFRALGTDCLRQQVEVLRRAEDDAAVLPVLRDDAEHLRREVPALIGAEPVLELVHDDHDALVLVLVVDKLLPVPELLVLVGELRVAQAFRERVCVKQLDGILHQRGRLPVSLAPGKYDETLRAEEVGLPAVDVRDIAPRRVPEQAPEHGRLPGPPHAAALHALTPAPAHEVPEKHRGKIIAGECEYGNDRDPEHCQEHAGNLYERVKHGLTPFLWLPAQAVRHQCREYGYHEFYVRLQHVTHPLSCPVLPGAPRFSWHPQNSINVSGCSFCPSRPRGFRPGET